MSRHPRPFDPGTPRWTVALWDPRRPLAVEPLRSAVTDARLIGIGESAHFVAEFSDARAILTSALVRDHAVRRIALEVGPDEAPALNAWLNRRSDRDLRGFVGPLTYALYGSFLTALRKRLPREYEIAVHGVDLPNSLTPDASLAPLSALLSAIDPASMDRLHRITRISARIVGGSAAASATSWLELDPRERADLTADLARLRARIDAIGAAHPGGTGADSWIRARNLADAAEATVVMLHAMGELFSGVGSADDTTVRERFVARRVLAALDETPVDEKLAYIAHNNHIQKSPVIFDGELAAYPAGLYLSHALGSRYVAVALSHADEEVPEMAFPATTDVGFRVDRVPAAPLTEENLEYRAAEAGVVGPVVMQRTDQAGCGGFTLRSQSANTDLAADGVDACLVVESATTDRAVEELGLTR